MSALGFTDQRTRIRRVVEKALAEAEYVASRSEEGRLLVMEVRRPLGPLRTLRFRGVKESTASKELDAGGKMRLVDVAAPGRLALIGIFLPKINLPGEGYWRVTIDVGGTRLDIVCQDAEWWEESA